MRDKPDGKAQKSYKKRSNGLALKIFGGLWNFATQVGVNLLAAYLATKLGM